MVNLLLHAMLKSEGLVVNKEHTYHFYCTQGLQARSKQRKKVNKPRTLINAPYKVNQRWSMDFVSDQLSNGRRFRILNVIDDYSR